MLKLAKLTDASPPAVTRVLFTPRDVEARNFIKQLMAETGLTVREDPMGNCFGRWAGSDNTAGCATVPGMHDLLATQNISI